MIFHRKMSMLSMLLILFSLIASENADYSRCRPANKLEDDKRQERHGVGNPSHNRHDHQAHEFFGCFGAPCSIYNEAFWFGTYAYFPHSTTRDQRHFLEDRKVNDYPKLLTVLFNRFTEMRTNHFEDKREKENRNSLLIDKNHLELRPPPDYQLRRQEQQFVDMRTKLYVPNVCDPRAYLYCQNSLSSRENSLINSDQVIGKCACNPLYSVERDAGEGLKSCVGRANTPCGFQRSLAFDKRYFVDEEVSNREIGVYNKLEDRERGGNGSLSQCMDGTTCSPLETDVERTSFKDGNIWHGFGYNPIMVEYIHQTATHICKCNDGKEPNSMHDCTNVF